MRADRFKPIAEYTHPSTRSIEVEWTGGGYSLCSGEWIIRIDGELVELPEDVRTFPMYTKGEHRRWYFDSNFDENWEYYVDGMEFPEWIAQNKWASDLLSEEGDQRLLYELIQEQDFRCGECGGCI